ncbi:hypothetical protein SAMN04489724_3740 [Algoriphagus locisalis]|uniref:Uncharacterized protein n=1 Tax=Algoriphagus locisalis TaxID=305507 RepID=A0A1I7D7X8_9BACT|nr:hypothetical protein [Algoriphagus locisalis]SFU07802.1 hypothetical protein SAMN04489724_3740 [Algoriphagus locisalis]
MPQRQKTNEILSPELVKILKIFGLISIGLVLLLSFFNTKRANNSGEDLTFRMTSSSRLYFLNVKAIKYDRESRSDAGMILFRHSSRAAEENEPTLNLVLILNNPKDEAYLYLEPVRLDWPLEIRATLGENQQEFLLENGNNMELLSYVRKLEPWIAKDANFEIKTDSTWISIWAEPKEKEALKTTLEDYFRLINERE